MKFFTLCLFLFSVTNASAANYECVITRYDNLVKSGVESISISSDQEAFCKGLGASRSLVCVNTRGHNFELMSYAKDSSEIQGSAILTIPSNTEFPNSFMLEAQSNVKYQSPAIISELKCEQK